MRHGFEAGTQTVEAHQRELVDQYYDGLATLVREHNQAHAEAVQHQLEMLQSFDGQTGGATLDRLFYESAQATGANNYTTAAKFSELTRTGGHNLTSTFTGADEQLWQQIYDIVARSNVTNHELTFLFFSASTAESQRAMRVALDYQTWCSMQKTAHAFGAGAYMVSGVLHTAPPESQPAMRAARDSLIWREIKGLLGNGPPDQPNIAKLIDNKLSSNDVRQAAWAARDGALWEAMQAFANQYGYENEVVSGWLRLASGPLAKQAMQRVLSAHYKKYWQIPDDGHKYDALFDGPATGAEQTARQKTNPDPYQEARAIVQKVVANNENFGWLATADLRDVRRVVNTVREKRRTNSGMTDRDIYLAYRRLVETPGYSEKIKRSFDILSAMMGGEPSGELPF